MDNYSELKENVNKILNKLREDYAFTSSIEEKENLSEDDATNWVEGIQLKKKVSPDDSFKVKFGASKICIIPKDFDFVIKIPFKSFYSYLEDDYREIQDYCDIESSNYEGAIEYEVEDFFAQTDYLFKSETNKYYVSEKVKIEDDVIDFFNKQIEKDIRSKKKDETKKRRISYIIDKTDSSLDIYEKQDEGEIPNGILILLFLQYGFKKTIKFLTFIEEWGIGDLHSANWGIRNNKIVCIDYSGFED